MYVFLECLLSAAFNVKDSIKERLSLEKDMLNDDKWLSKKLSNKTEQ